MSLPKKSVRYTVLVVLALATAIFTAAWPGQNQLFYSKPDCMLALFICICYWFGGETVYWSSLLIGSLTDYFGGDLLLTNTLRFFLLGVIYVQIMAHKPNKSFGRLLQCGATLFFASAFFNVIYVITLRATQDRPVEVLAVLGRFLSQLPKGFIIDFSLILVASWLFYMTDKVRRRKLSQRDEADMLGGDSEVV